MTTITEEATEAGARAMARFNLPPTSEKVTAERVERSWPRYCEEVKLVLEAAALDADLGAYRKSFDEGWEAGKKYVQLRPAEFGLAPQAEGRDTGLRKALTDIAELRGKTLISVDYGQRYSIGANAAFEQTADIADRALSTKEPE